MVRANHRRNPDNPQSRHVAKKQQHDRENRAKALLTVLGAAAITIAAVLPILDRRAQHTSILTGEMWMQELLQGHSGSFYDAFGMSKYVFWKLLVNLQRYGGLRASRGVAAAEILGIFLHTVRTGTVVRHIKQRFQHSAATIHRCFHTVLECIVSPNFFTRYVFLPSPDIPAEISGNPKFNPFFADCIGATDGTHFSAHVPAHVAPAHRNRKGFLSQNVLACCTFDMRFCYVMAGWEGSVADSRLWAEARGVDLRLPEGKYLLGDAGFPTCDALLVPYRGVRYHLKEYRLGNEAPSNYKELFNLRHAALRNVIERIFGALKRKFPLPTRGPAFPLRVQAMLISATCLLWNFIQTHDPEDLQACLDDDTPVGAPQQNHDAEEAGLLGGYISPAEKTRADVRRDDIAQRMWLQYQQVLRERMEQ